MGEVFKNEAVELRCGDWRTVLADVGQVDTVIVDPPYGARTHDGNADRLESMGRASLGYEPWTPADVHEFVESWARRCSGWMAAMTSDDLVPHWRSAYRGVGRADFAPVPTLQHRPRLSGDGPGSCAVYLMVSRPRSRDFMSWGSLPGWYEARVAHDGVPGGKPVGLMRALVCDYSRPGDLIVDPCAGGATTLRAAELEGRRCIGAEMDPKTFQLAADRLRGLGPRETRTGQLNLLVPA